MTTTTKVRYPATGAINRTVGSKAYDTLSVKDFGAKGDGVTDDTVAIQTACYAAAGKTLTFPSGEYVVVDGFAITSPNTTIRGDGATILYKKPSAPYFHCVRVTANNCRVDGLHIIGQPGLVRGDSGFGVSVFNDTQALNGVVIENCVIENIASAGIWVTNTTECVVTQNRIRNCLADGIHFADGCSQIVVSNNILIGCEDDNIALVNDVAGDPSVFGFSITGNFINAAGVPIGGGGVVLIGASSGSVTGNTIINTYGAGVQTYFWSDAIKTDAVVISGNKFSNNGRAAGTVGGLGILLQHTGNVHIVGNEFSNIQYNAAASSNGAIWITDGSLITITANKFFNIACDGIHVKQNGNVGLSITANANVFGYIVRVPVRIENTAIVAAATVKDNIFESTVDTHDIYLQNPNAVFTVEGNVGKKAITVQGLPASYLARTDMETVNPVVSSGAGTITAATATMNYQRLGRFIAVTLVITVTNNGTGASDLRVALPFSATSGTLVGRESTSTGQAISAHPSGSTLYVLRYDNAYPAGTNTTLRLSGLLTV